MRNMKTVNYDEMFTLSAPSPKWVWNKERVLVEVPAGQPAYDHDPLTGEPLGQRLEHEENNVLPDSNDLTANDWVPVESVIDVVADSRFSKPVSRITTNGAQLIEGARYTDLIFGSVRFTTRWAIVKTSNPDYLIRVGSRTDQISGFLCEFNLSNGTFQVGSSAIGYDPINLGNGWWAIGYTVDRDDFPNTAKGIGIGVVGNNGNPPPAGIELLVANIDCYDGQVSAPSSPIYTSGSAVIRGADALDAETIAGGLDQGAILARCQLTAGAPVLSFDGTALVTAPDGDSHVYVISYDSTETLISIDGADATTGAGITPSLPLNVFRDSSNAGNGYIEDLVFSPIKKTAAQVKAASAAGEL